MNRASLLVVQGVDQGTRFELEDVSLTIGRGAQNEIRVMDTEVSRVHATIQRVNENYVLTDRNSSNGTFVNGNAVRSRELHDGDQIQMGRTLFLFVDAERQDRIDTNRVQLIPQHDPADRSSIVGRVDRPAVATTGVPLPTTGSPSDLIVLYRIAEEVVRPSVSMDQTLQRILDLTIVAVGADRGCVLLTDPESGDIRPRVVGQRGTPDPESRMPVSRTIVDFVLKNGQGVRTSDAQHDSRFDPTRSIVQAGIREALCVPMQGRHELMGALYLDITTPSDQIQPGARAKFGEDQLRLLVAIGRQAALAIENNRYQRAFVKAERLAAMGQTIATLSHHIKNILQGVRGGSYLIDLGLKEHNEELIQKGWHVVDKNQNKIYNLVMDMLTFSKERQPELKRAQLNETVGDIVELMQSRAAECSVDLRYQPDATLPESTFDAEGIHRAVLNIVTNAIDAVEGANQAVVLVETGLSTETDMLWVSVADNGPGIPEEHLGRIFNVFESTKGARGTGLGLAVSQKIIREHGGDITIETKLGEGSRFTLAWPRQDEEHPASQHTIG